MAETTAERMARRRRTQPWLKWHKTARWQALRLETFARDKNTCQRKGCGRFEPNVDALVCVHIVAHEGDERLFWDPQNVTTNCKPCQSSAHQREMQGYQHKRGIWD